MHARPLKEQIGSPKKLNAGLLRKFWSGLAKLNQNRLMPTTNSLSILGFINQRQFTAKFFGVRKVSTTFGKPGSTGRPPFTVSPRVFWCPADQRTNTLFAALKVWSRRIV